MSFDFATAENAICTALALASGYAESKVVWSNQNLNEISGNFITMKALGIVGFGLDGINQEYNGGAAEGEELTLTHNGPRVVTVSVQAYTVETVGLLTACFVLDNVRTNLKIGTTRDILNEVGLGILDIGDVQNLSDIQGADFEGRAAMDIQFCLIQSAEERIGYIETVEGTAFELPITFPITEESF